jgi:hypothetical protein
MGRDLEEDENGWQVLKLPYVDFGRTSLSFQLGQMR